MYNWSRANRLTLPHTKIGCEFWERKPLPANRNKNKSILYVGLTGFEIMRLLLLLFS